MAKLTVEQKKRLLRAIDTASGPGACRYVYDGAPCCVVAQLAALEGISVERMAAWDASSQTVWGLFAGGRSGPELAPYRIGDEEGNPLLDRLQAIWDRRDDGLGAVEKREAMRALVEAYTA